MIPSASWEVVFHYPINGITVSPRMEEMPSVNKPVQRLKVTILPLDLPHSRPVNHSGEILTTGKSHGKKSNRFSLNDNMDVENSFYNTFKKTSFGHFKNGIQNKVRFLKVKKCPLAKTLSGSETL